MAEEIIICNECKGEGVGHYKAFITWSEDICKCFECKGSGRLLKTTTVKIKPYKQKKVKNK